MGTYPLTIQVPDELARRLRRRASDLPRILELGLRQVEAEGQPQFDAVDDVLAFLAALPDPAEVMALRASPALAARVEALLAKNLDEGLTPQEVEEWGRIERLEHIVRMAKIRAQQKLDEQAATG
jgi:hypothetical protein